MDIRHCNASRARSRSPTSKLKTMQPQQQQQQKTNKIPKNKNNNKQMPSSLHSPKGNNKNNNINTSNSPTSVSTASTSTHLKRGRRPSNVSLSPQIRPGSRSRVGGSAEFQRRGSGDFQRRPPARSRSMDPASLASNSPVSRDGDVGSRSREFQRRPPARVRSMDTVSLASKSPVSRDGDVGGRNREFQRRPPVRVRSMDPSSIQRGQQQQQQRRQRQQQQHPPNNQNQNRARSMSPSRMIRARSVSPSRIHRSPASPRRRMSIDRSGGGGDGINRGRSIDRSGGGGGINRGRSIDRSVGGDGFNRGRSIDRSVGGDGFNRGRSIDRSVGGDSINRGRSIDRSVGGDGFNRRDGLVQMKEYPRQTLHPLQRQKFASSRRMIQSFRQGISKRGLSWCQLAQYVIASLVLIGASIGLIFASGNGSIVTDTISGLKIKNSEIEDPYSNGNAPHWPADGNGLRVTIINALSDDWQTTFALAVTDWNFGDPNAVDIVEKIGIYTPNCEAPDGTIIVCNGDYGDSKWRGINEALLDIRGEIVSTTARMNTYYLSTMDSNAWQYTMCHELGHTLGLGHTDENYNNKDLRNCMDYTNNLKANKSPDTMNYETLLTLYGPISGRRHHRLLRKEAPPPPHPHHHHHDSHDGTINVVSTNTSTGPPGRVSGLRLRSGSNNKSNKNILHRDEVDSSSDSDKDENTAVVFSTIPDHIRKKKREVVKELLNKRRYDDDDDDDDDNNNVNNSHKRDGWNLVHRKLHGEEYEMFLGEGYKVRVQFLLV